MALTNCKECNKEVSDNAKACPHCGYTGLINDRNQARAEAFAAKPVGKLLQVVFFSSLFYGLFSCMAKSENKISTSSLESPSSPGVTIPSDSKATYYYLGKTGTKNQPILLTKRVGPSGISYAMRVFNCKHRTTKYLGTGDTIDEVKNSQPDENMGPIIQGSIAWYHYLRACNK